MKPTKRCIPRRSINEKRLQQMKAYLRVTLDDVRVTLPKLSYHIQFRCNTNQSGIHFSHPYESYDPSQSKSHLSQSIGGKLCLFKAEMITDFDRDVIVAHPRAVVKRRLLGLEFIESEQN